MMNFMNVSKYCSMNFLMNCLIILAVFSMSGCGVNPDKIKRVEWMGDKEAVVTFLWGESNDTNIYRLKCGDQTQKPPFEYEWSDDCSLSTMLNGRIESWSSPKRKERDAMIRNQNRSNGDGIDFGDVAIGAIAGSMLSGSSSGNTTVHKTTYVSSSSPKSKPKKKRIKKTKKKTSKKRK